MDHGNAADNDFGTGQISGTTDNDFFTCQISENMDNSFCTGRILSSEVWQG